MIDKIEQIAREYTADLFLINPVKTPRHKGGPKAKRKWEKELAKFAKQKDLLEKYAAQVLHKDPTKARRKSNKRFSRAARVFQLACEWNSRGVAIPRYATEMTLQLSNSSNNSAWTLLEDNGFIRVFYVWESKLNSKGEPYLINGKPLRVKVEKQWVCPPGSPFHGNNGFSVALVNPPAMWGRAKPVKYQFMGVCLDSFVKKPFTKRFSEKRLANNAVRELVWRGVWQKGSAVVLALPKSGAELYYYDLKTKTKKKI